LAKVLLVGQVSLVVQQLHDGEDEEPEAEHPGEDAQDEDGGAALVQMASRGCTRIEIWIGDAAKPNTRAEGGHEQERDADDDANVEHCDSSFLQSRMPATTIITRCCDGRVCHVKLAVARVLS
jgi:hypothetical protein